jgi:AcrR family transcriptional regulator
MPTAARILRATAQDIRRVDTGKSPSRDHILAVAQCLIARYGRNEVTFANLAIALCIGTPTLRNHFADLDALLGEILRRHLHALSIAIGKIPASSPDRQKARRAAYFAFTRTALGGLTEAHLLLKHERQGLAADERATIDDIHHGIGRMLAGSLADEALDLLDNPRNSLARVETILATPTIELADAAPAPMPPPATLQRPIDPEAPGAWIFNAGIPGLPPAPATVTLPKPPAGPRTALPLPHSQAPPATGLDRSTERKLQALTRKLMSAR